MIDEETAREKAEGEERVSARDRRKADGLRVAESWEEEDGVANEKDRM